MRLSTKGRYAVTAMLDLAIHDQDGPVTLSDISSCQDISLSYLEQLFSRLRRENLVTGVRGPGGGYRLALPASRITIATIVAAVDENVDATCSGGESQCKEGAYCLAHDLWCGLSERIFEFLDGITLADFINRAEVQAVIHRQDTDQHRGDTGKLPVS